MYKEKRGIHMTRPIRILHVFGRLDSGGAESRTMDIYKTIDRAKVQFDYAIHTTDDCYFTDEVKALGGKIYNFPRFNGKNYLKYRKAWNLFFQEHREYKIIHGHQTSTGFIYLDEAKKNKVPIRIAHSRNSNKDNKLKQYVCKMAKRYATHLFAVSRLAAISEFGKDAVTKGNVEILPNAIDAKKYVYNRVIRDEKRNELGFKNELVVCHIGRFHPQKNHMFLLEIFKTLNDKYKNTKLVLIGDGSLRKKIENKIKKLEISNSVIMTGIRSDVPQLLQAMDVLIFPSFYEGLPGVVLEAQAAGLPCIISDTITSEVKITELVEYVSLAESPDYWVGKTLKFLQDFERRNTYDVIVESGYDIEAVASWYQEFYIKLMTQCAT